MAQPIRFYTTESLSSTSKRAWTPEGFLLCSDVPIARTGMLLYGRGEIPVAPNPDGIIRIMRDPEDVFHPNAILSFAGKPVTDDHPPSKVTPDNWKQHSIGTVLNPRRGNGGTENNELVYADLLIQDRQAISDVLKGKREVSAGYDAEYEQIRPGEGKQHNIIGNHVALVERGRCGPICSIGDSAMAKVKVRTTPIQRRMSATRDAIMRAFMTGDEETLVDELDKVDDMMGETATGERINVGGKGDGVAATGDMGGTHIHVHTGAAMDDSPADPTPAAGGPPAASPGNNPPGAAGGGVTLESLAQRMDQLEQAIAILANGDDTPEQPDNGKPPGMSNSPDNDDNAFAGDRARVRVRAGTGDSASMALAFQEVISRAELLVPGMRAPTFDSAKPSHITSQTMCDYRRQTINQALRTRSDASDAIMAVAGNPKRPEEHFGRMTCDALTVVFNGASEIVRTAGLRSDNNNAGANTGTHFGGGNRSVLSAQDTVAKINEVNRARYNITGR